MSFKEKLFKIIDITEYVFFPKRCCSCGKVIRSDLNFCDECNIENCRIRKPKCYHCGQENSLCGCSTENRKYNMITAPFYYIDEARNSIKNFKFHGYFDNGKFLADEMAKTVKEDFDIGEIDLAIPVSLSKKRRRQRGFSQTNYLTKIVAEKIDVEYRDDILIKIRETPPQAELKAKQRRTNLKDAYKVKDGVDLSGKTVLLCDDVKTTGTTLNECTRMLRKAGAKKIYCLTAAISKNKIIGEKD